MDTGDSIIITSCVVLSGFYCWLFHLPSDWLIIHACILTFDNAALDIDLPWPKSGIHKNNINKSLEYPTHMLSLFNEVNTIENCYLGTHGLLLVMPHYCQSYITAYYFAVSYVVHFKLALVKCQNVWIR